MSGDVIDRRLADRERLKLLVDKQAVHITKNGELEIDWVRAAQDDEFAETVRTFAEIQDLVEQGP